MTSGTVFCGIATLTVFLLATDFDPEDLERGGSDSEDEGGRAADSSAGREHYQAVG